MGLFSAWQATSRADPLLAERGPVVMVVEAQERRRGSVTVTFGGIDGASSVRLLCYDQETAERLFELGARFELMLRRLP